MPDTANWYAAMGILAVMAWMALETFSDILPWHLIDPSRPDRKRVGIVIIVILGTLLLLVYQELMQWVWMGIKHILLMDIDGVV